MLRFRFDEQSKLYINLIEYSTFEQKLINLCLRKRAEGFMFQARYRNKKWDGYDKFLRSYEKKTDPDTGKVTEKWRFGVGLWQIVIRMLRENNIQYEIENLVQLVDFTVDQVKLNSFVELLLDGINDQTGEPMSPRDYQFESAFRALKYKYCTQELATSAGKTIIFYVYLCYLKFKKQISPKKKALIVVPKVSLLNQTYEAFMNEYNNGLISLNIMRLGDKFKFKQETFDSCDILISTYQSLSNIDPINYSQFNVLCIDECHTSKGDSISDIIKSSPNATYKFGLSGTIQVKPEFSHLFKIQEFIGPLRMIVSSEFLQVEGYSPNIHIKILKLVHPMNDEIRRLDRLRSDFKRNGLPPEYKDPKSFGSAMFEAEKQYLYGCDRRLDVISNLLKKLKGNTLILFNNIKDSYGKMIQEKLQADHEHVHYIDGSVEIVDRESFQRDMELIEGVIIVASYGTFSTGLNIKRLHNIVLAESSKSEITIRQSIGRGMRQYAEKNIVNIFDLVDEFEGSEIENYMISHGKVRQKIYVTQKFVHSHHSVRL